ncbi:MAG TPA: hypothetical protein VFR11_10640 [Micromonosporaceae bacterium]|jgi:hypothetical protein|nr:hypothetical protein [Micromonosporaceae bacterium]
MLQRLRATLRSTPTRLTGAFVILLALDVGYGALALGGASHANSDIATMRASGSSSIMDAQTLYTELSDADASASAGFLATGSQVAPLHTRYGNDILRAAASLTNVIAASPPPSADSKRLIANLAIYHGMVTAAQVRNPTVVTAEATSAQAASRELRNTLLPSAQGVYAAQSWRLATQRGDATTYPYYVVGLGAATLIVLLLVQRYLTRRTRRRLNVGLAGATLLIVGALIYQNVAWAGLQHHLRSVGAISDQTTTLVTARVDAREARSDEALALMHDGGITEFEAGFDNTMTMLVDPDSGTDMLVTVEHQTTDSRVRTAVGRAIAHLQAWQAIHADVRQRDASGDHAAAVAIALGQASSVSDAVDGDLFAAITAANDAFARESRAGSNDIEPVGIVVFIITLLALFGLSVGIMRRQSEYR